MSADLSHLTIAGLFSELTKVEQAIRACDPTFTSDGAHTAVNAQLVALATQEQEICDELARRRSELRDQMRDRLDVAESSAT